MSLHSYFNEFFTLPQLGELLLRIVVATLCGIIIGLERTKRFKEAGIRTHFLVACGAAAMMIVSKYGFIDLALSDFPGAKNADGARIAAQVVSGIGFLGAGMIFRNDTKVNGLTTAAGLWATAGIGLTIGAGMYTVGVFATVFILALQWFMHHLTFRKDNVVTQRFCITLKDKEHFREEFLSFLDAKDYHVHANQIQRNADGSYTYVFRTRSHSGDQTELILDFLNSHESIISYNVNTLE